MTSIKEIKQKEELQAVMELRIHLANQVSYWAMGIAVSSLLVSILGRFV